MLEDAPPKSEETDGCTMICVGTVWEVAVSEPVGSWVKGPGALDGKVCTAGVAGNGGGVLMALVAPGG